ncbi:MAG: ABC transporter permease [Mycoplasma sp.]
MIAGIVLDFALIYGAILLIGGLSGLLSERAGIVNIGIDGMMCFGALFYGIFSSKAVGIAEHGLWTMPFVLLLTMLATTITGLLHGYACINLKANHIISGTAINLIGVALCQFANLPLAQVLDEGKARLESGYTNFLFVGNNVYGSSIIIFIIAILIAVGIWVVLNKTKTGLRYKAVGENPFAVAAQGISVLKYQWTAVILSSAFAGLAGALFLFKTNVFNGDTEGLGYLALAIMIVGAWKVEWTIVAAWIFALFTGLTNTDVLLNAGVPKAIANSIPYIITLVILVFFSKWVQPPEYDGIPYDPSQR